MAYLACQVMCLGFNYDLCTLAFVEKFLDTCYSPIYCRCMWWILSNKGKNYFQTPPLVSPLFVVREQDGHNKRDSSPFLLHYFHGTESWHANYATKSSI